MTGNLSRATSADLRKLPQEVSAVIPLLNPVSPSGTLINQFAINLILGAAKQAKLHREASLIYSAVSPLLALLSVLGAMPSRVRVNPPGGASGFEILFGHDIFPVAAPGEAEPYENGTGGPYNLQSIATNTGVEITFSLPGLPFYGMRILENWQDRVNQSNGALTSEAVYTEAEEAHILSWDLSTAGLTDVTAMSEHLFSSSPAGPMRQFVDEVLGEFTTEAEQRANSHLYSLGLSGVIFDPDTWQHLFRWHERPSRRRVRIETIRTIGLLVWRGLTGPNADTPSSALGNAVDGPAKVTEMLHEEIFAREALGNVEAAPKLPTLLERIEAGLAQHEIEGDLIDDAAISEWNTRRGKSKGLIGKLARILSRDHKRILEYYDDQSGLSEPPDAGAIGGMTVLEFIDLLMQRGFLRYEGDKIAEPPGTAMDGIEARAAELIPVQANVQMFLGYWQVDRAKARRLLMVIERDLLIIRQVMLMSEASRNNVDTAELRNLLEDMRGALTAEVAEAMGFPDQGQESDEDEPLERFFEISDVQNFRDTLYQAGPVTEGAGIIAEGASAARRLHVHALEEETNPDKEPSEDELYDAWLDMGMAITSADRFLLKSRNTKNPSELMERFIEGFAEGARLEEEAAIAEGIANPLGDTTAEKLTELFKNHIESIPVNVIFPQVFASGLVFGMVEYSVKLSGSLAKIFIDPAEFASQVAKAIDFMIQVPTGDLFFMMGKGMGHAALKEVDRLNTYTNPIAFVFQVGRLLGPLVLEEIISLLFEAYVLGPALHLARAALRTALRQGLRRGGVDYMDTLRAGARLSPDFLDEPLELLDARAALKDDLVGTPHEGMELEDFVDQVLDDAENLFNDPPGVFSDMPDAVPPRSARGGMNEPDWLRHIYGKWRDRVDYLMREGLLDTVSDAVGTP